MMGFGAAGGAATFVELKDTPETYTGEGGKLVKVKAAEDGLEAALLLSFADWYSGGAPASYPWILIGDIPFTMAYNQPIFSPILKNEKDEYYVYVSGLGDALLWKYNLTTRQWVELASPSEAISWNGYSLAMSPDGTKLAVSSGGEDKDKLQIYDIEANTWLTTAVAPDLDGVTPGIGACVWADNDTVWAFVKKGLPTNCKMYKYTVSTTTWATFANSTGALVVSSGFRCAAIKTDGTVIYVDEVGATYHNYLKYTIATDIYDATGDLGVGMYGYRVADKNSNKLWFYSSDPTHFRYFDVDDESYSELIFEENPQRTKPTNISIGVFEEAVCIAQHQSGEPLVWSYVGSGMWKLGEQVLTDYNLVVFKKPADGYAITALDKINNYVVPVYLFSNEILPAGTWEFFYPKDGDYTKLVISGSELK